MNLLKKKVFYIPVAIILFLMLYSTSPQAAGAIATIGSLGWTGYLYIKSEKFKARGKVFKTITTIGLFLFFITFGIGGLTYDPIKAEQSRLATEKVNSEQNLAKGQDEQKAKEEQKVKEQQKAKEEQAKKEAEEQAKVEADAKKKVEEEQKQKEIAQANASNVVNNSTSSSNSSNSGAVSKPTPQPSNTDNQTITVYTTNTGHKYHRDGCRYLRKSKIPISLDDAKASGLGPCSVCNPPQ